MNHRYYKTQKGEGCGFTIVEIIIVLGILTGIVALVGSFQSGVFSMNRMFGSAINISFESNKTLKDITNTVRPITQSAQGAFPIATAGTSTFTFFSDTDADGITEQIRYYLASTTLMKGVTKATGNPLTYNPGTETKIELLHFIRNPATSSLFSYYDRNYAGTSTPLSQPVQTASVRHIRITLTVDEDINRPPFPITVTSAITLRNLKDNQ
jgi:type II secretory pathway pseudopilin PulG